MTQIQWSIEGPHVVNCNCAFGCPCQFAALPTDGTCKAVVGWRIDKGHYGETRLDGLLAVNLYAWPGAIHHGNGAMQSIIDGRADAPQRKALAAILQGEGAEPGSVMPIPPGGKNPEVATVRPPARQSPAGAALRPDWRARILAGFLAVCTRRTRVPQRVCALKRRTSSDLPQSLFHPER
jgi:hypothetical protein